MSLANRPPYRARGTCLPATGGFVDVAQDFADIFWLKPTTSGVVSFPSSAGSQTRFFDDELGATWTFDPFTAVSPEGFGIRNLEEKGDLSIADVDGMRLFYDSRDDNLNFGGNTLDMLTKIDNPPTINPYVVALGNNFNSYIRVDATRSGQIRLNQPSNRLLRTYELGDWIHLVIRRQSNGDSELYINGQLEDSFTSSTAGINHIYALRGGQYKLAYVRGRGGTDYDPAQLHESAKAFLAEFGESF